MKQDPNYNDSKLYKKNGDVLNLPPFGFDYLGWMTVKGDTLQDACMALLRLTRQCKFLLEPIVHNKNNIPKVDPNPNDYKNNMHSNFQQSNKMQRHFNSNFDFSIHVGGKVHIKNPLFQRSHLMQIK